MVLNTVAINEENYNQSHSYQEIETPYVQEKLEQLKDIDTKAIKSSQKLEYQEMLLKYKEEEFLSEKLKKFKNIKKDLIDSIHSCYHNIKDPLQIEQAKLPDQIDSRDDLYKYYSMGEYILKEDINTIKMKIGEKWISEKEKKIINEDLDIVLRDFQQKKLEDCREYWENFTLEKQKIAEIPYIISLPERKNRDESCGTISLHAIFKSYGIESSVDDLNQKIAKEVDNGSLPTDIISLVKEQWLHADWYTTLPLEQVEEDNITDSELHYIKEDQFGESERWNNFKYDIEKHKTSVKRKTLSMDEMIAMMKDGKRIMICNGLHYMVLCRQEDDYIVYMNPQWENHYEQRKKQEIEQWIYKNKYFNAITISNSNE